MKAHVLVVDDEIYIVNLLRFALTEEGYKVSTAANGKEALDIVRGGDVDLVLTDMKMPVMDGMALLGGLKAENADVEVIVLTGHGSMETAIAAFKTGGVSDFIQKPLDDIDHLLLALNKALEVRRLKQEKLRMQAALSASERFSQAVIDTLPSHLLVLDKNGFIIRANQAWERFVAAQFTPAPPPRVGDDYLVSCVARLEQPVGAEIAAGVRGLLRGDAEGFEKEFSCNVSRPERWFLLQASRLEDADGAVVISHVDITFLKDVEADLIDARKMEAVSTLAAGVAHQYNNALSAVVGAAEILEEQVKEDPRSVQMISMILTSARQMGHYNKQLISYAESGVYDEQTIPLNLWLRNAIGVIRDAMTGVFDAALELSDDVGYVKGDAAKLQTALYEIVLNAVEATEGAGSMVVSTRRARAEGVFPATCPKNAADDIVISVKDDGIGVDDDVRRRMFDPFFTTKFIGRGLGLPAALGIVRNHGGRIDVASEAGEGTTVRIYLPACEDPRTEIRNDIDRMDAGEKTALIIEDNPFNLRIAEAFLEKMGFLTLTAENGETAVRLARMHEGRIDLAVLDMMLPDMGGEDVYPLITAARPDMKVIICSGYSRQEAAEKIRAMGAADFIQKPIAMQKLKAKLRDWFDIGDGDAPA